MQVPKRYSSKDWLDNLVNLPRSRLLARIEGHLLFNTCWAGVVSLLHWLTPSHLIDDLHVSTLPHTTTAGALALLLVFRTNAAYDRFWEARKVWGSITNTVRNLVRLSGLITGPDKDSHRLFCEYLKAYPYVLKQHLQNERVDEELSFLRLPTQELVLMQSHPNAPLFVTQRMAQVLGHAMSARGAYMKDDTATGGGKGYESPLNGDNRVVIGGAAVALDAQQALWYRIEVERQINALVDYLGMCERILGTPVPRSYSRHTSRFLTLYCLTLPVVLVPHTELFTAAIVGAVSWGMLSIEAIAYAIENPFDKELAVLPLGSYCEKIRQDSDRQPQMPPLELPADFKLEARRSYLPKAATAGATAASSAEGAPAGQLNSAFTGVGSPLPLPAPVYAYMGHNSTVGGGMVAGSGGGMMERLLPGGSRAESTVLSPEAEALSARFYPELAHDAPRLIDKIRKGKREGAGLIEKMVGAVEIIKQGPTFIPLDEEV